MSKTITCSDGKLVLSNVEKDETFRNAWIIAITNQTSKGFMLLDWKWLEQEVRTFFRSTSTATVEKVEISVDDIGPFARVRTS